jgi:zinc protease
LHETTFSEAAFKRQQQETLEEIKAKNQEPTQVTKQYFMRALYANDPYGHVVIGEEESIKKITMQDAVQFHQHYYGSHNAVIAIVGAVDKSQAEEIANRVVEKLPSGKTPLKVKPPSAPKAEKIQVKFPSTQTTIYMGQLGVTYEDKDFFPLMVANYTLGGADVSKLYSIVRNRDGLAYAVFSTFVPLKNVGPFVVFLQTKNSNVEQAVALVKKLIVDFIQQGPTESELKAAKANLIGSFPLDIASNKDIAEHLVMIGIYHLPLNYLDTFPAAIKAVTMEQIKTALKNRIKPDNFIMVTVGGK